MTVDNGLGELFNLVLAASRDRAYLETVERMQAAYHQLILAEAESRRNKTTALILAMAKIDGELYRFMREYDRIAGQLTQQAINDIDSYLRIIEQEKKDIAFEKNALKKRR